jgi:hypothetical protein
VSALSQRPAGAADVRLLREQRDGVFGFRFDVFRLLGLHLAFLFYVSLGLDPDRRAAAGEEQLP